MKLCLIGKFPPIQGGVSMRMFRIAHGLAARGHAVDVVTNAAEVEAPFGMFMRKSDWAQCEAVYDPGYVRVHWTEAADRRQQYIPMASPFVSKLASLGLDIAEAEGAEAVFSFYLEPYAVAGGIVAQELQLPHVIRTAGSDIGRLFDHPQLQSLYTRVLRNAAAVVTGPALRAKLVDAGIDEERLVHDGGFIIDSAEFCPDGAVLDLAELISGVGGADDYGPPVRGEGSPDRCYVGVYGKLGAAKGSFQLLAAARDAVSAGGDVGLLVMGQGDPPTQHRFNAMAEDLGLADRVLQIPFLPPWRVPEFLRRCDAVCVLEQDFPIRHHAPVISREVLTSGTCLIASAEMIDKLPMSGRLVSGYNCCIVDDVNDIAVLAKALAGIADNPSLADDLGSRGRRYACEIERRAPNGLNRLESILAAAVAREPISRTAVATQSDIVAAVRKAFDPALVQSFAELFAGVSNRSEEPAALTKFLKARVADGDKRCAPLLDVARAAQFMAAPTIVAETDRDSPRLQSRGWGVAKGSLLSLFARMRKDLKFAEFDYDINVAMDMVAAGEPLATLPYGPSIIVIVPGDRRGPSRAVVLAAAEYAAFLHCTGDQSLGALISRNDIAEEVYVRLFDLGVINLADAPAN